MTFGSINLIGRDSLGRVDTMAEALEEYKDLLMGDTVSGTKIFDALQ